MTHPITSILEDFAKGQAAYYATPKVYPFYLACKIKEALAVADMKLPADQRIIGGVEPIVSLGDCRYLVTVIDHNGAKYDITVSVRK